MRSLELSFVAISAIAMVIPTASVAAPSAPSHQVQVVSRGANGHATAVVVDGKEYAVCSEQIQDSCINPYQAGLKWGHEPLDDWPGEPASELHNEAAGG